MTQCLCMGGRTGRQVDKFLTESLADPPTINDDDHFSKSLYTRISSVISPRDVDRHESHALVNFEAAGSLHPAPSLRKMTSMRLPSVNEDAVRLSDGVHPYPQICCTPPTLNYAVSSFVLGIAACATSQSSAAPTHSSSIGHDDLWSKALQTRSALPRT